MSFNLNQNYSKINNYQMAKALKDEFVNLIINDASLQGKIAASNNKSGQSVLRWARQANQKQLTMSGTLHAIAEHTGKKIETLTKEVKVQTA